MLPFNIPLLGRPILWYGFLFAFGFFLGYWIFLRLLKHYPEKEVREKSTFIAERVSFYVIIGTVIGARIGDVLFYRSWAELVHDPFEIFKIWQPGLASHGGAAGILVALWVFVRRYKYFTWLQLLDLVVIPTGLVGCFIRIGNFVNQEILGKTTSLPWAVVFGHPADGSLPAPRHPVQLYEAGFYLLVFLFLYTRKKMKPGRISGIFITLIFSFRFLVEFLKVEQSPQLSPHAFLDMGQILSLPFIALGLFLYSRSYRKE